MMLSYAHINKKLFLCFLKEALFLAFSFTAVFPACYIHTSCLLIFLDILLKDTYFILALQMLAFSKRFSFKESEK